MVRVSMVCVFAQNNTLAMPANIVSRNRTCLRESITLFIENPCSNQNPCLNSGTCFGRYHINGTLSTQCFCPQGHTGLVCEGESKEMIVLGMSLIIFLATLCSPTSCNGGVCTATQNNIVCVCPTGKSGDRCQVSCFYLSVCLSDRLI